MIDENHSVSGFFFFDPSDPIYAHHFPGKAAVPGSLVINAFLQAAEKMGLSNRAIHNFRFRRFVSPGECAYRLEWTESGIRCSLFDGDVLAATGMLGE